MKGIFWLIPGMTLLLSLLFFSPFLNEEGGRLASTGIGFRIPAVEDIIDVSVGITVFSDQSNPGCLFSSVLSDASKSSFLSPQYNSTSTFGASLIELCLLAGTPLA
jgi:hypothetical protein